MPGGDHQSTIWSYQLTRVFLLIIVIAVLAAVAVTALLTFGGFARTDTWRATVTPLASIIGSGFLICGPLLAREFGAAAILAMAALLALAYAVGAVVRFNIVHVEDIAPKLSLHDPMAWAMRLAQVMLAIAYAVSVAYYLKLLAEFTMKPLAIAPERHGLIANLLVTVIILALTALTFSGSIKKIEHAAHASVSVKLGIITGLLAGLATWWATHAGMPLDLPPTRLSWSGVPLLLGLVITVQGFETSRYMGGSYDQPTRVRTMRYAQWLSSAIYLAFLGLLTPFLTRAQHAEGVAGILDIMTMVAPLLGVFVLVGAVSSQLSAAIADSIGSGGLMIEVSRRRLGVRGAFLTASALSIAVVWLTDPFSVIALSSRAFALFYAMQAVLAVWVSFRSQVGGWPTRAGFAIVGLICIVAAFAGAPAES
ncbi:MULTISPECIES: hypothetical protein [unclassified Sphingomonas]|uniref:hypothetical protein n=1 Tax=unclassified Sphingomonas TaxID=196159 RepID=UPI002269D892|nr:MULTISPECIES: hypothetical protein [unclassified Sphingomonas]